MATRKYGAIADTEPLLESNTSSSMHWKYPPPRNPSMSMSNYLPDEEASQSSGGPAPNPAPSPYKMSSALLIFLFPAFGGLLFGYDIGATSAVVTQLTSDYAGVTWSSKVSDSSILQGTITSIGMLGALLGSLTCFQIADDLGRRRTLIIASFLFVVGSMVESMSGKDSYNFSTGVSILILGRLIYGYGCGFAMHGAPAYIGEMAPTQIRGLLVSLKEAFIVVGMVLGYSIGYGYSTTSGGWRWVYWWSTPIALAMMIGMYFLPYSARWLALKGRIQEARQSLYFVTPTISETEIAAIYELAQKASDSQKGASASSSWIDERMTGPTIYPALVAGIGLVFLQQVTGQPSVLYYADSIFEDIGLDTMASILLSGFKLIATLFTTFTVDNYGRKFLLQLGCSLMLTALAILVIAFLFPYTSMSDCNAYTLETSCPSTCEWLSSCSDDCSLSGYDDGDCSCCTVSGINTQKGIILGALFLYIGGYQVGFGPISWLMISEIFPLEVRGKAVSMAVVTNFFWNFIMSLIFAVEVDLIGTSFTFLIYGVILIGAMIFIHYRVPETKGLSLEQIEEYFLVSSRAAYAKLRDNQSEESAIIE